MYILNKYLFSFSQGFVQGIRTYFGCSCVFSCVTCCGTCLPHSVPVYHIWYIFTLETMLHFLAWVGPAQVLVGIPPIGGKKTRRPLRQTSLARLMNTTRAWSTRSTQSECLGMLMRCPDHVVKCVP